MFEWMTRRRRMEGGLYFGAPGWTPEKIEGLHKGDSGTPIDTPADTPADRAAFRALLETIGLDRTSAISPGLLDQVRDLGERRIRALIVNLLPTQPEFAIASAMSHEAMDDMTAGLAAVQKAVRARRVLIALDRHDWRLKRRWKAGMRRISSVRYLFSRVLNQYPQAHPTLLLWSLFGKRTAVGKLPTRANRVIVDPVACWALGRYLRTGQRLQERPVQLFGVDPGSGRGVSPRLVMGRIGETIGDFCIRYGLAFNDRQLLRNGMLAGDEVFENTILTAGTESLTVRPWPAPELPTACFSCGWCLDVCPTRLNPVNLLELAEMAGREDQWQAQESMHCIGCGLCSYVCPTRLPLTQEVLKLRTLVSERIDHRNAGAKR